MLRGLGPRLHHAVFITILALVTLTFQVLLGRRGRALIPAAWLGLLPLVITQMAAYSYRLIAVTDAASGDAFARTPAESQMYAGAFFTLLRTAAPWFRATDPGPEPDRDRHQPHRGRRRQLDSGADRRDLGPRDLRPAPPRQRQHDEASVCRGRGVLALAVHDEHPVLHRLGLRQVFAVFFLFQIRSWGRFAIIVIAIAYVILGIAVTYRLSRSHRRTMLQAVSVTIVLLLTVADLVSMPAPFDADRAAAEAGM